VNEEGAEMSNSRVLISSGILRALFIAAAALLACGPAAASEHPVWWDDALTEGEHGHYDVLDFDAMREALQSDDAIVIDVRPDYEHVRGHIPGSVNFEFHPGHAMDFPPEKREAFKELVGPDKDRMLVIYCRNFR
jgi:rhodanese-related sulfurtransferase